MIKGKIYSRCLKLFQWTLLICLLSLAAGCSVQTITDAGTPENSTAVAKAYPANSFVALHGKLKVVNRQLCDKNGVPVQLQGMSTHGLQWYGQFVTPGAVSTLATNWKATVVRAAMYTKEGGYIDNPAITNTVINLINYAEASGIYCIIDWHILSDGDPNIYKVQSKAFFEAMARMFGTKDHVLYEICNEPNGSTVYWTNSIKLYADYVIPAIRVVDPYTVIIVGTAEWSQRVDEPAARPLSYANVLYALHFYSGTHTQWLRDRATAALPYIGLFVSEWGTSTASGTGGPYLEESQLWLDYLKANKISWCNWSLCDKAETSAALVPGASVNGSWPDSMLTTSGLYVKRYILSNSTSTSTASSFASSAVSSAVSSSKSSVASSAASSAVSSAASSTSSTSALPGAFVLIAPKLAVQNVVKTSTVFDWADSAGAASYTLVVDNDPAFGSPEINKTGITTSTYTSTVTLGSRTKYYWKVIAVNAAGSTPTSSTGWYFTTTR